MRLITDATKARQLFCSYLIFPGFEISLSLDFVSLHVTCIAFFTSLGLGYSKAIFSSPS